MRALTLAAPVEGEQMSGEIWRSAPVLAASRAGDYGRVIALVRTTLRISQKSLAEACGLTQSSLSRLEHRGVRAYNMQTLAQAAASLRLPPALLGLAEGAVNDAARKDSDVDRRSFLAGAAALAAPTSLIHPAVGDPGDPRAAEVRAVTAAYRRLDGAVPARQLVEPVRAHLRLVQELAQKAAGSAARRSLAAAGSELASFAAWLSWDMADRGSARVWYGTALASAQQAGDPLLWAYQAGSLAQLEADTGSVPEAVSLLAKARKKLGKPIPAIADAWLASLEAQAYAALNDERGAAEALDRCEVATEQIPHQMSPPWPWVFSFTSAKVARARITCGVKPNAPRGCSMPRPSPTRAGRPATPSGQHC